MSSPGYADELPHQVTIKYSDGRVSGPMDIDEADQIITKEYPTAGFRCGAEVVAFLDPWELHNAGKIIVWACYADSVKDDGAKAVATIYSANLIDQRQGA